jgi:tetratricopeptide (TPR) repeat protein/glutathione synthase/RimK-type ligase-like ATP-grasp enzyme
MHHVLKSNLYQVAHPGASAPNVARRWNNRMTISSPPLPERSLHAQLIPDSLTAHGIEAAIVQIERRLALDPAQPELQLDRGQLLEMVGRKDEAVQAYTAILRAEPTHPQALNALGLMCLSIGNHAAARALLRGAVLHGPDFAQAHANLAYLCVRDHQLEGARTLYERALRLDPELAIAHHGLAELLTRLDDGDGAERHRQLGMRYRPITISRYIGDGRPIHILGLGTAAAGNVPTFGYFDNRVFLLSSLIVEHADPATPLPPHDIVFNAIGEADLCSAQLTAAARVTDRTAAPVINHPRIIARTSRTANARRLGRIDGVVTPLMARVARHVLSSPTAAPHLAELGFTFPLLVRSPGFHTGDHFVKVRAAADLAAAVAALPGDELFVIAYVDVADAHGWYRKYRVIIVDGHIYPLHLAISRHWKVHYFSADMTDSPAHRSADAAFVADMQTALGAPAIAALERIRDVLGLDYGGIDFGITSTGDVIVFEANASMIVPSPDEAAIWDYRRPPVARIRAAVRRMLVSRAAAYIAATGRAQGAVTSAVSE